MKRHSGSRVFCFRRAAVCIVLAVDITACDRDAGILIDFKVFRWKCIRQIKRILCHVFQKQPVAIDRIDHSVPHLCTLLCQRFSDGRVGRMGRRFAILRDFPDLCGRFIGMIIIPVDAVLLVLFHPSLMIESPERDHDIPSGFGSGKPRCLVPVPVEGQPEGSLSVLRGETFESIGFPACQAGYLKRAVLQRIRVEFVFNPGMRKRVRDGEIRITLLRDMHGDLPGCMIRVRADHLFQNGKLVPLSDSDLLGSVCGDFSVGHAVLHCGIRDQTGRIDGRLIADLIAVFSVRIRHAVAP